MSTARPLLQRLLDLAGDGDDSSLVLVLDGEGLETLPPEMRAAAGTYAVHRATTELGLRHRIWQARGAPLIVVLPQALAERVQNAPDILRRARKQRIHALSINDVLEVVLGVRVVGAETPTLEALALEHVEALARALGRRTLPTVVDRRLLTELLVDASVGEQVRRRAPAELLAGWLRSPPHWTRPVTELVCGFLAGLHSDEGKVLAWGLERPEPRLGEILRHGALMTVEAEQVPEAVWGPLWRAADTEPLAMDRRRLRQVLAELAEAAIAELDDAAGSWLVEADALGRRLLEPAVHATSRVLPLAFEARARELAARAASGRPVAASEVGWLSAHRAARVHRADLEVIDAMARLSRWLDSPWAPGAEVRGQVEGYQRDGAFADLAVARLRRALSGSAHFHDEAAALLERVRSRRDRQSRHFADTLAAGYERALHAEGATPLHRLWRRIVAPMWAEDPKARLYLVVLDGCSCPVFLELLHALAQDPHEAIGLAADADGRVALCPALAPLPTVTSHARGAIFLGDLPQDPVVAETTVREGPEAKTDKARLNQNPALVGRTHRLFLKGDLADGGPALYAALRDEQLDVVAAVFNAVDDQIGSSNTGSQLRIRPEDVTAFRPSLQTALRSGRRVLVTADHGHSPYVDRSRRVGAGATPRYMSLPDGEAPPEGFVEIDLGGLGGPAERRAFAWQGGVYLGGPQVGFHGGCSLEEMVVPLAWLVSGGLAADEPAWWYGGGRLPPGPPERPALPPLETPLPPEARPPTRPTPQLGLFDGSARKPLPGLSEALVEGLSRDERAVLEQLADVGVARASELAERLRKSPMRLNGLIAKLRRSLHAQGVVCFDSESLPDGDVQYRWVPPGGGGEG